MPAINVDYSGTLAAGVAGAIATTEPTEVISRTNEDASITPFGRAVFRGTRDKGATKTAAADTFLGVVCLDRAAYTDEMFTTEGFRQYDSMSVLRKGVIWVQAALAVNDGQPAYVTPAGTFSNASSGNTAIANAFFETSTTAAGLVQLRLR